MKYGRGRLVFMTIELSFTSSNRTSESNKSRPCGRLKEKWLVSNRSVCH
ncbi:hypothetical protein RGT17_14305 [Bacillus altitudinis]|nr:hypothetical protein [Bacillus pumilus]MDM5320187.1 hypothetical protein [Bacillus pumilus]MDR4996392.1 hypothetical protein [Bacillus altitudinis]